MIPSSFAYKDLGEFFVPTRKSETTVTPVRKSEFTINTIVIDPGHGGKDTGVAGTERLWEKDLTLLLAEKLADRVLSLPIYPELTEDQQTYVVEQIGSYVSR